MITVSSEHHVYGITPSELYGLSTDAKPTDVNNASIFYEMDTKKVYLFDEESGTWLGEAGSDKPVFVTVVETPTPTRDNLSLPHTIFPNAETIGSHAFGGSALTSADFPIATSIDAHAFYACTFLQSVDFSSLTSIGDWAFSGCTSLQALILRCTSSMATREYFAFDDSSIANGTGYVYVPKVLVEQYKTSNNWSDYASQFRALEDYTVDGTITGELDESKI